MLPLRYRCYCCVTVTLPLLLLCYRYVSVVTVVFPLCYRSVTVVTVVLPECYRYVTVVTVVLPLCYRYVSVVTVVLPVCNRRDLAREGDEQACGKKRREITPIAYVVRVEPHKLCPWRARFEGLVPLFLLWGRLLPLGGGKRRSSAGAVTPTGVLASMHLACFPRHE